METFGSPLESEIKFCRFNFKVWLQSFSLDDVVDWVSEGDNMIAIFNPCASSVLGRKGHVIINHPSSLAASQLQNYRFGAFFKKYKNGKLLVILLASAMRSRL